MKRLIDKILIFTNSVLALLLLLAYLLPFLFPQSFPFLAVLSLGLPVLIIINIFFFIYWLFRLRKPFFISLVTLLFGFPHLTAIYQQNQSNVSNHVGLRFMSFNVRLLNHFNWINQNDVPQKIQQLLKNSETTLVCFQEFYNKHENLFTDFPYRSKHTKTGEMSMSIFSKHPIIHQGVLPIESFTNGAHFVDIVHEMDTIRVYNIHLQSFHIPKEEVVFSQASSELLFKRLGKGFSKQQSQAEIIKNHMMHSPYPVVLMGDFNNGPHSYVYRKLKGDFLDAFQEKGNGFGITYWLRWIPLRIDFALVDPNFRVESFETLSSILSDHQPISVHLKLQKN